MKRERAIPNAVTRAEIRRALNRAVDVNPVIQSGAPTNETGKQGIGQMRVYQSGATRELQIQIDGTWFKATLTAV